LRRTACRIMRADEPALTAPRLNCQNLLVYRSLGIGIRRTIIQWRIPRGLGEWGLDMKIGIVGAGKGWVCLRARRRRTRECPDDCDRGPNAQTRRGGCDRPALRRPALSKTTVVDGDYEDLANSELVMITAGINEKAGAAIDRSDPKGRLRLFDTNAEIRALCGRPLAR
jgi:hypothetical protein